VWLHSEATRKAAYIELLMTQEKVLAGHRNASSSEGGSSGGGSSSSGGDSGEVHTAGFQSIYSVMAGNEVYKYTYFICAHCVYAT
jgi:hypothetical protein